MNFENELNKIKQKLSNSKVNENPIIFSKKSIKHLYFIDDSKAVIDADGILTNRYEISYRIALDSRSDGLSYINPSDIAKELNKELKQAKGKKIIRFVTKEMYDSDNKPLDAETLNKVLNSEDLKLNQPKEYDKVLELLEGGCNG